MKLFAVFLLAATLSAADGRKASLAVVNARVWTGNPARPWAAALAVAGDCILAVGGEAEVRALVTPSTRVIDGHGGMVAPGFIDAHLHLLQFDAARPHPPLFLRFLTTRAEVAERIAARATAQLDGTWILGEQWTDRTWGGPPPPRAWLDSLAPQHPVWLTNSAGDAGIANTLALRMAGLSPGGQGDSDRVIRGDGMSRVEAALIDTTRTEDDHHLELAMDRLARAGVTSVHHNNTWHQVILFRRLHQTGRLRLRIFASVPLEGWRRLKEHIDAHGRGDAWLRWGGLKGYGVISEERYYPLVSAASRAGLQVMAHVGDEAGLRALVAVYGRVRREQNLADPRFRVEHAHDMPPDVIPLIKKAGALVSWQPPLLAHYDQRTAAGTPPPRHLFWCRALLDQGVRIAFGTDTTPGRSAVPPLEAIRMALERTGPDGSRITLDEALSAFTRDAAYAEFAENEKGTLEPGKLADFVLLDRDLSTLPVHRFGEVKVRMTVVDGKTVFAD